MQLIFESETNLDTNIMATLEDSFERKIVSNGIMEDLNKDARNGFIESIQSKSINVDEEITDKEDILLKSPSDVNIDKDSKLRTSGTTVEYIAHDTAKPNTTKEGCEKNETSTNEQSDEKYSTTINEIFESAEVNCLQNANSSKEGERADKPDDSYLDKDELTLLKEELALFLAEDKLKNCAQESHAHKIPDNVNMDTDNQVSKEITSLKEDVNKEDNSEQREDSEESSVVKDTVTVEDKIKEAVPVDASISVTECINDEANLNQIGSLAKVVDCDKSNLNTRSFNIEESTNNINLSNKPSNCQNARVTKNNNEPLDEVSLSNESAKCKSTTEINRTDVDMISNKETLNEKKSPTSSVNCENNPAETKELLSETQDNLGEDASNKTLSESITKIIPTNIEILTATEQTSNDRKNIDEIKSFNTTVSCNNIKETNQKIDDVDMVDTKSYSTDSKEVKSSPSKTNKSVVPAIVDIALINNQTVINNESEELTVSTDVQVSTVDILLPNNKIVVDVNRSPNKTADVEVTDVEMTESISLNKKDSGDGSEAASKTTDCKQTTQETDAEITTLVGQSSTNNDCVDDYPTFSKTAGNIYSNNNESIKNNTIINTAESDDVKEVISNTLVQDTISVDSKEDIVNVEESKENKIKTIEPVEEKRPEMSVEKSSSVICKLSNTLNILSDDEDEPPKETQNKTDAPSIDKNCINIDDDDDIMLIEDTNSNDCKSETKKSESANDEMIPKSDEQQINDLETVEEKINSKESNENNSDENIDKDSRQLDIEILEPDKQPQVNEKTLVNDSLKVECSKPLLRGDFLKSAKKNLADMTRDDLEELCILKIVESIVDRSNLSDIKTQLKSMAQNIEEYRKKAMMLTKQNRDLQVVLKSIQEEQKKSPNSPITPLKITRSVGMQVLMTDKPSVRRKIPNGPQPTQTTNNITTRQMRNPMAHSPRNPKMSVVGQNIPVPRLVPANSPATKPPTTPPVPTTVKAASPVVGNGPKNPPSGQKSAEKRQHNRAQSVTVDLTDDEPPAKINAKNSPAPPVRLVPSQNLLAPQRQPFGQSINSPRKVYIPISGPQGQNIRAGHAIMLKSMPTTVSGPRQRCPTPQMPKIQQSQVRVNRIHGNRHPAPLPDAMKQYQPPTWKALPPAPDLKLSKVENGIVISWKIDGYQEDSYEEIASYQLYAYQETSSPPNTALWKKIGDVKALPLPMACTLTQFMAGFKYYFAVRAVDIRSRLGPFSLPGSILLLNKM